MPKIHKTNTTNVCAQLLTSSKLLAFVKQLEDHEVAVLELERQLAVLELGESLKQLSDHVNESKALEWERQLAVVELEGPCERD